jgi:hypothetical protein
MAGLDFDFRSAQEAKRHVRRPVNKFDKTTIVSIFPKTITADFVTMEPSYFTIPGGSVEKPTLVTIGPASWWSDQGPNRPKLEITVDSNQMANSIIRDSCLSRLGASGGVRQPGVFVVPGEVTLSTLLKDFKPEFEKAKVLQKALYEELIRMADIDWARFQGNPLAIHDDSRIAATELGRKDKPWMGQFVAQELIPCSACGAPRNPKYPVCGACHNIIDMELAKSLNIKVG